MIKRLFYKLEHCDGNSLSSSSSSSSSGSEDFDPEDGGGEEEGDNVQASEEEEEKEVAAEEEEEPEKPAFSSTGLTGSGYESEDSSRNEINFDSTGLLLNDSEEDMGKGSQNIKDSQTHEGHLEGTKRLVSKDSAEAEMVDFVLKFKSVFKCRICPRIVCLSEDTLLAHLRSKRHARSKKLFVEGRLKLMLNSDGEVEEEQETHAERHARTIAIAEKISRKNKGRQQQTKRRKLRNGYDVVKTNPQTTKRRKIED